MPLCTLSMRPTTEEKGERNIRRRFEVDQAKKREGLKRERRGGRRKDEKKERKET
jgi:hypothetical protein